MPIQAPYNFVPLSKKVVFPDWAGQVSHDIPFSDGISGEISCSFTTESPIYVRNGGNWSREEIMANQRNDGQSFFRLGDEYIVPGSSLKGMLRGVIEIMSFGKMGRVDDRRYSVRDLQNPGLYGNHMTTTVGANTYQPLVHAAWLTQDENRQWHLIPCEFARVEREDLVNHHPNHPNLRVRQGAVEKYRLWGNQPLEIRFDCTEAQPNPHSKGRRLVYRKVTRIGGNCQYQGTIVLTGQPAADEAPQHRQGRKHLEFVFFNPRENERQPLPDAIRKDFIFIHSDDNGNPNTEWEYWRRRLQAGQSVPVFYLGTVNALQSIGLAMMYRLPYKNTIHDAIRHTSSDHFHQDMDLAETIFGREGEPEGLKGRVWVSQATARNAQPAQTVTTILNSPKPTYYPSYIEQQNLAAGYKTLMNDDCRVRGWKRYPTRMFRAQDVPRPGNDQMNVSTKFIPLNRGAQFTFKIRVHNLKPVELSALLWALQWGGDGNFCHSLGMGKSYGFGQIKIQVETANLTDMKGDNISSEGVAQQYEAFMNSEVGGGWRQTLQMSQLLAMANPANAAGKELRHMSIAPNQFVDGKKSKQRLEPHVRFEGVSETVRFQNLQPRQTHRAQPLPPRQGTTATQPKLVITPQASCDEEWKDAQLTYDAGGGGVITAQHAGKSATLVTSQDTTTAEQVPQSIIGKLKGKKKRAIATVSVVPCGGGRHKIVAISE